MAEEIGFNFFLIKPSDIQSKFVNASQEIIKTLFDEARKQAPSIIFLDELDALVPRRDTPNMSQMNANAVNEFLAQMNNTGDEGIFIIGASNRPTSVDPAILRSGRLDKLIYLPPPDEDARREMFELHLAKRPIGGIIDYAALARKTDNFVSSDIRFLCDEAARRALRSGSKITNDIALETIGANRPSLTLAVLETYKSMKSELEGVAKGQRNQIGFNRK
jgi:transitional endoplasmic reticulum ATPase